jgi:sugar O-acyltransferase (sialic acid O-acetyltransferase NeuD family)
MMFKAQRILLIGAGGHARSCVDVLESAGWEIVGLLGLPDEVGNHLLGHRVLGSDNDYVSLRIQTACENVLVAIGQIYSARQRIATFEAAIAAGFNLPFVVASSAYVSPHAQVGEGTIVMHGAIINAGVIIGENCIINSRSLIEHGVRVGNHCHIATGAVLNGDVEVGEGSFVGSTTVVREGVVLGRGCVVGMGLSIRHNQPDGARVVENC